MKASLVPGLSLDLEITVTEDMVVKFFPENVTPVYSTPSMIWHMEEAARMAILPHLDEDEGSVGISVNVKHLAATPLGMKVRTQATLIGVEGRVCNFRVESFDEKEKIGEGIHQRFIIDLNRFAKRLKDKNVNNVNNVNN